MRGCVGERVLDGLEFDCKGFDQLNLKFIFTLINFNFQKLY